MNQTIDIEQNRSIEDTIQNLLDLKKRFKRTKERAKITELNNASTNSGPYHRHVHHQGDTTSKMESSISTRLQLNEVNVKKILSTTSELSQYHQSTARAATAIPVKDQIPVKDHKTTDNTSMKSLADIIYNNGKMPHDINAKLRHSNQQIVAQCKMIRELKQRIDDQDCAIDNLKSRLTRSENVCHHKQLLLESYKSKLNEIGKTSSELSNNIKATAKPKNSYSQRHFITACNEMKMLEDNVNLMKRRESELNDAVGRLNNEKQKLINDLNTKNLYIKDQLKSELGKLIEEKRDEITKLVQIYKDKVHEEREKTRKALDRLRKYENGIDEFLWMVEDHIYEKVSENDPVRKAHQMACTVLHLSPQELREMFRDCENVYSTIQAPRLYDNWVSEYKQLIVRDDIDFAQRFSQFLYKICFTNVTKSRQKQSRAIDNSRHNSANDDK